MSGLILRLAAKERFLLNGVVVENGDRKSCLSIKTPSARILRLRDAIHPDEVSTPATRACYLLQLTLSGDVSLEDSWLDLQSTLSHLEYVFSGVDACRRVEESRKKLIVGNLYGAFKILLHLVSVERELIR